MTSEIGTKKEHENDVGQRNDLAFGGGRVSRSHWPSASTQFLTITVPQRVCAGIHVAKYSAVSITLVCLMESCLILGMTQIINAMHLLWAFDFSPAKDAKGEEIKPDIWDYAQVCQCLCATLSVCLIVYFTGLISLSEPFQMHDPSPQRTTRRSRSPALFRGHSDPAAV